MQSASISDRLKSRHRARKKTERQKTSKQVLYIFFKPTVLVVFGEDNLNAFGIPSRELSSIRRVFKKFAKVFSVSRSFERDWFLITFTLIDSLLRMRRLCIISEMDLVELYFFYQIYNFFFFFVHFLSKYFF